MTNYIWAWSYPGVLVYSVTLHWLKVNFPFPRSYQLQISSFGVCLAEGVGIFIYFPISPFNAEIMLGLNLCRSCVWRHFHSLHEIICVSYWKTNYSVFLSVSIFVFFILFCFLVFVVLLFCFWENEDEAWSSVGQ